MNTFYSFNIFTTLFFPGRWWLIGSGWSRASSGVIGGSVEQEAPVNINMNEFDAKLLEVARKQRMNTDVRRAIFCIVMGSEDYLDAFEKLVRLGLKNKQEREIVFVIIHCCSMVSLMHLNRFINFISDFLKRKDVLEMLSNVAINTGKEI